MLVGFLIVPLRRLILVIIRISLNKKKPRSFRPPWPCGIDTKSNNKNWRSCVTRSEIPSITPWIQKKNAFEKWRSPFLNREQNFNLLPVHEVHLHADHFPMPHVLYNSNVIRYRELVSMLPAMVSDPDDQVRCVLSVLKTLIRSWKKKGGEKNRVRI